MQGFRQLLPQQVMEVVSFLVSALTQIEFIATEPDTLIADASPDILGPDGQTSTISAVVRDINGNLVKNSVVNFSVSDVSTGFVSPSQATTDSKGIATTVFTSGSVSSEDDVVVTASVADDSAIFDDVFLTVGSRAFDIVIGRVTLLRRQIRHPILRDSLYLFQILQDVR